MLSAEVNELLTRTDRGTPAGELLRRYWQPAALSEELSPGGPPLPLRLLGEELVLFRDRDGRPALLALHCSHRGADLSYGRLEDGGLRCIYHGWLYDGSGRCLEQPGEPVGSTFHEKVQHVAYPCQEVAGFILAYMGPGSPPLIPAYEFFDAPPSHRLATKVLQDCNYLQANEGNLDPAHLSFLHRLAVPGDLRQSLNRRVTAPHIETEETDFGVRIYAIRPVDAETNYVRLTNFILPNLSAVAGNEEGYNVHWHVPIDDTHHWRYELRFNRHAAIDPERALTVDGRTPDYRFLANRANRYFQDRESMKSWSFCGLGDNFPLHDACAVEGAGPIQDRTQEHLGYTDRAIMACRQALLAAIHAVREGRDPPHINRDPATRPQPEIYTRNDVVLPASFDWHGFWRDERAVAAAASTEAARDGATRRPARSERPATGS